MIYLNSPHSIDPGTRNFFLSISGSVDLTAFSTITGIRSGYFVSIRLASAALFSTKDVLVIGHLLNHTKRGVIILLSERHEGSPAH